MDDPSRLRAAGCEREALAEELREHMRARRTHRMLRERRHFERKLPR